MSFISNYNDQYTWSHGFQKVYQAETNLKEGRIVNVTKQSHISNTYDVELFETEILIEGCRVATSYSGFNGVGTIQPLEEGTPVLVQFKNGVMQDGYIVGCFFTEGIYKQFYKEGKLQEPNQLVEGSEFNQVSGHPNRITQEESYFKAVGSKVINSSYSSPELLTDPKDKYSNRTVPSSIELRNQGGDIVQYSMGTNVVYSDGNIVQVSSGSREEKTTKLLRLAAMHLKKAEMVEGKYAISPTEATNQKSPTGLKSLLSKPVVPDNKTVTPNVIFTPEYIANQERKLAELYTQAAQVQSQLTAARQTAAQSLTQQYGTEVPGSTSDVQGGTPTSPNYKPNEKGRDILGKPRGFGQIFSNASSTVIADNGQRLHPEAAAAYQAMKKAAKADNVFMYIKSGYRSIATQQSIWDSKLAAGQSREQISRVNAVPGRSEHHTGYAADILDSTVNTGLEASFNGTPAYKWLAKNAGRFGFENSYPNPVNFDGVTYEPWHWRYVGSANAKAIFSKAYGS
ncbi:D-alanyl-D-alanine carboxypeptidase family protein [Calothrix sp. FACHB-1219]|uniref:M15 family metallopeptidase n=1 Tax=unclassified Calothrix TaxID=2619626 RepID=UPI0016887081|nr:MULTISPECIES: M15 family metallopeptidase [unclassified Calothrix]MBD2201545.1 D-alanyl-D-alanine carboxypeptidase family protein [Calothrix sp. FACHB-168]MBD2217231.1 D-alanyl-D-alanine carboxypeptidase family protein [Calothrix sp. FACHB-1219]